MTNEEEIKSFCKKFIKPSNKPFRQDGPAAEIKFVRMTRDEFIKGISEAINEENK